MKLQYFPIPNFILIILVGVLFLLGNSQPAFAQDWEKEEAPLASKWYDEVSPDNALPEYPRPLMKRDRWKNLNGLWGYSFEEFESPPHGNSFESSILVPFAIESALSGVKEHNDHVWYRRTFEVPDDWRGEDQLLKLHFGAADWASTVYVNGQKVGTHKGGYDRFSFDITSYLKDDGPQEVLVYVEDPTDEGNQPRGKQVLNPRGIWYTPVTGIWQTVWLEPVPKAHITDLQIIPDPDNNRFLFKAEAANIPDRSEDFIVAKVYEEGVQVNQVESGPGRLFEIPVPDPHLWSPDDPFLYDLKVSLKINDVHVDSLESYAGMRSVEVKRDEDGHARIFLNGEYQYQIGPLDQGYWPGGLYTAPTDEALKYDLVMAKKMGFNMIRKHVKWEPQRWYYWADKLGILVWQDMVSADNETSESRRQFEVELKEMVRELYNHPSLVNWMVFNEGWGQFDAERLTRWVESYDPSRIVTDVSGWQHRGAGDLIDVHRYPGPAGVKPDQDRASAIGEFGGIGFPVEGHTWQDKEGWGYQGLVKDEDTLLKRYEEVINRALWLADEHHMSAGVYTQITDLETELNGLMTYDRAVNKLDPGKMTAINKGRTVYIRPRSTHFTDQVPIHLHTGTDGLTIHYTTDGSEPTLASPLYEEPFSIEQSTTVKARAFRDGEPVGYVTERTYTEQSPVEATALEKPEKGLVYRFYRADNDRPRYMRHWPLRNVMGGGDALSSADSGTVQGIDIRTSNQTELFGYRFDGYIKVPESGNYTFYIESDDNARMYVSGKDIFDRMGQSPATSYDRAMIPLEEGFHPIDIRYFQAYGPSALQIKVDGPGIRKQLIPTSWLYY